MVSFLFLILHQVFTCASMAAQVNYEVDYQKTRNESGDHLKSAVAEVRYDMKSLIISLMFCVALLWREVRTKKPCVGFGDKGTRA